MTALLTYLMMTAWGMWQHQNKALHTSENNYQDILEDKVNQHIYQVYAQDMGQLSTDAKSLIKQPFLRLLKLPVQYKH